jgi:hypothetical protein
MPGSGPRKLWYDRPRSIVAVTASAVVTIIAVCFIWLLIDLSQAYGDNTLDGQFSPHDRYAAWLIERGEPGSSPDYS